MKFDLAGIEGHLLELEELVLPEPVCELLFQPLDVGLFLLP